MAIDWGKEPEVGKPRTCIVYDGIKLSPWLEGWIIEACERDIRKMTRAIEKLGDGNYGFLQDELLYCSHELMELHGYITRIQLSRRGL